MQLACRSFSGGKTVRRIGDCFLRAQNAILPRDDNHGKKVEGRPCSVMTTAAATTARLDRELKVPKFKRCKISRQQLYVLLTNFGARRSCPAPHSNLISP